MPLTTPLLIGAGALALLVLAPFLLPSRVHVERSAVIDAAPQDILALAASNSLYQTINPYRSTDPALQVTLFGPASGVGSGFRFEGKDGKGSQTVAAIAADSVTYAIDLGPMGKPTQTLRVEPGPQGTRVTWRMDADLGMNPVARVFGLFMDGMIGKTFDQGLTNLAAATKV